MGFDPVFRAVLGVLIFLLFPGNVAAEWQPRRLLEFGVESCRGWEADAAPAPGYGSEPAIRSDIRFRGARIGTRFRLQVEAMAAVELEVIARDGHPSRFVASLYNRFGDPLQLVALDPDCSLQIARQVNYTENGQATSIVDLDRDLTPRGAPEWLNPPLDFIPREPRAGLKHPGDATPQRVGLVDSGVNYLLPEINRRLARDEEGHLIGYDFWDRDALPFDAHPVNSGFFVQRHGTRTASILLREAPEIELVPYRYPRPDMSRMRLLVEHAAANRVGILAMPLGSNRAEDWSAFEHAARDHPEMLFIASAGNNGRDIDAQPVYPAALGLDNLLVVTSADDFVRPAERTNWGRISVDYLLPAERLPALDYSGEPTRVSGSSYAVSRLAALVARMKAARPDMQAGAIIAALKRRYGRQAGAVHNWVGSGYIADPLAGAPVRLETLAGIRIARPGAEAGYLLALDLLLLDPRWSRQTVSGALQTAFDILRQCGIAAGDISVRALGGPDYLRDLSTGNARTLLGAARNRHATVVFARDTLMQAQFTGEAFGAGNTRMRPWLANSVWLMLDVDDPGIALAHELFHVLANRGDHVETDSNLMQGRTRPEGTALTPAQCRLARDNGLANGLIH